MALLAEERRVAPIGAGGDKVLFDDDNDASAAVKSPQRSRSRSSSVAGVLSSLLVVRASVDDGAIGAAMNRELSETVILPLDDVVSGSEEEEQV